MGTMDIMDGATFWNDVDNFINEFKAMANNRLITLLTKNDGIIHFSIIHSNTDPIKITLNEMYEGGVRVEFYDESSKSFKSLSINEMIKLLHRVEEIVFGKD